MDKKDLQVLISHNSNLNNISKFALKLFEIILDKYGYDVEDWYCHEIVPQSNLKNKTSTKVLYFYHVKDTGLERVKITCKQDKEDSRIITHYKSFMPFNNLNYISFSDDEKEIILDSARVVVRLRNIHHFFETFNDEPELAKYYNFRIPIEPFHRLLVRKFDEFWEHEYDKNQFFKANEIRKFKELLDERTITQEEFELFKKDLLN